MKLRTYALPFLACCLAAVAHADWGRKYTESFRYEGTFLADGSVTIENVNGKIVLQTWDRDAYLIEGEKRTKREEDLARIEIQEDRAPDHLNVKVKLPKKGGGWFGGGSTIDGSVELVITVPASAHVKALRTVNGGLEINGLTGPLRASTVNGGIAAHDLGGDAHISTVNGGVRVDFTHLDAAANLEFETVNGSIRVGLPADAGARVKGSVVNGHIESDLPLTLQGAIGKRSLNGTIGDGAASLSVSTVNGSIHLSATKS